MLKPAQRHTSLEKETQQTPLWNSPSPITCSVVRLIVSQILTCGWNEQTSRM